MPRQAKGIDLAYTAGIIDGEGCIGIYPQRKKWLRLSVTATNTNEWLIEWLRFSYGGNITCYPGKGNKANKWVWQIWAHQAGEFLKLIAPYLKIKRPQAELAIQFQQAKHWGGRSLKAEERVLQEAQAILMHKYNKKGASKNA